MTRPSSFEGLKQDSLLRRIASDDLVGSLGVSYVTGLAMGATGRLTRFDELPAVLPALDLMHGNPLATPGRAACYVAYGCGVATAYADKVCAVVVDLSK